MMFWMVVIAIVLFGEVHLNGWTPAAWALVVLLSLKTHWSMERK